LKLRRIFFVKNLRSLKFFQKTAPTCFFPHEIASVLVFKSCADLMFFQELRQKTAPTSTFFSKTALIFFLLGAVLG